MRSMSRLYSEVQQENLVTRMSESVASSQSGAALLAAVT
jgi:hypothetical protein